MEVVDSIPSSDNVSRHLYYPFMYDDGNCHIAWNKIFTFQRKNKFCDSVVWRKYAESIDQVHAIGCEKVKVDNEIDPNRKYVGAYTGSVREIRDISTDHNIHLEVVHDPTEDQGIHHAHLKLLLPDGMKKPSRNDRSEIFSKLEPIFKPLEENNRS